MLVAVLLLCAIMGVTAHNFISSPSRSRFANTLHPCLPRTSNVPHVYAGADDEFVIEYPTGHGRTGYFALIEEKDEPLLKTISPDLLDEYIKEAPNGEGMKVPARKWRKFHRKNVETWDDHPLDNHYRSAKGDLKKYPMYFKAEVAESDPVYVAPPKRYGAPLGMFEFKDEQMVNDRSVAYKSDKYPHILLAKRFGYEALQPYRNDVARFKVPAGTKSGNLVLWWYWSGYRDCIDVLYNATSKASSEDAMYGVPAEQETFERIDHCNFPDVKALSSDCMEFVSSPEVCFNSCNSEYGCTGVIVAPVVLPDTVPARFRNLGQDGILPWGRNNTGRKLNGVPINYSCDKSKFRHADANTYACVAVKPRDASETYEEFEKSNDPMSPYFYSTCYYKRKVITFENVPPPQDSPAINWRTGNTDCVTCQNTVDFQPRDQRTIFGYKDRYDFDWLLPTWSVPEHCVNCDMESAPARGTFSPYTTEESNKKVKGLQDAKTCDGLYTNANKAVWEYKAGGSDTCGETPKHCYRQVTLPGRQIITNFRQATDAYRCNVAAYNDPLCSDDVVLLGTFYRSCFCRLKDSCCGSCVLADDRHNKYFKKHKPEPLD